jgi:5'-3' exonuclease
MAMANKMKETREKLDKIKSDRDAFNFRTSKNSHLQQVVDDRATFPKVIEADILGRDQEKQKLIDLLVEAGTSSDFIVLPICGIGGIGKTTLAQLLFNDTHFKNYEKAWVYVSQTFDKKKIEDDLASQLEKDRSKLIDIQESDAASKKILIVLDDLWENDDFKLDDLKISLKIMGNGQKVHVIVTTRDIGIAQKIQTIEAHKIDALSLDVCWIIIKQIVDFEKRAEKERLEVTGKEIAEKCGGVPLAARAIGYILRSRRDIQGWISVKESGIWNISSSGSSPYDNVLASLKLSYSIMLPRLRLCFAYCAVFPKGHKLAKDKLIYQWATLGFIKPSEEFPTWQHGEDCIKQLLEMSFLQHSNSPAVSCYL